MYFIESSAPWFVRGGSGVYSDSYTELFYVIGYAGCGYYYYTYLGYYAFRVALAPTAQN